MADRRGADWRLRSRGCLVIDGILAAAGAGLFVLTAVDSVASWPSNHVIVAAPQLSRVAFLIIWPGWLWIIGSLAMVSGSSRRRDRGRDSMLMSERRPLTQWPLPARACAGVVATAGLIIIAGSAVYGFGKGSARILPGPRYQVSTNTNQVGWTTVSAAGYHLWQARFVREDSLFMFFALILTLVTLQFWYEHHRLATGAAA